MAWVLIVWELGAGALPVARVDMETVTTRAQAMCRPDQRQAAHGFRDRHRHFLPEQASSAPWY